MSAGDHLNPQQFPLEKMHDLYSGDYDVPMRDVAEEQRDFYENTIGSQYMHDGWLQHRGPDGHVDHLTDDIRKNGIREPIKIRNENVVIDGHHRYRAAVAAGLTHVPVVHIR